MSEPDVFIPEMVKGTKRVAAAKEVSDRLTALDNMESSELMAKIEELRQTVVRVRDVSKLQRNRDGLIQQHTYYLLSEAIQHAFEYYEDILHTFDFGVIVDEWDSRLSVPEGCELYRPLPAWIDRQSIRPSADGAVLKQYFAILDLLCERYSNGLLPATYYANRQFLIELERNLRSPKKLSEGLNLDMNYLAQINRVSVFVSFDSFQAKGAEEYAKSIEKLTSRNVEATRVLSSISDVIAYVREGE